MNRSQINLDNIREVLTWPNNLKFVSVQHMTRIILALTLATCAKLTSNLLSIFRVQKICSSVNHFTTLMSTSFNKPELSLNAQLT